MKLLLFADLHLDTPFRWAGGRADRRRQSLRDTLASIVDLAVESEVDALCCAGDLYEHDRVAPDTGAFLAGQFARLAAAPVLIAPGNHDWYGPTSLYQRTSWSPNVHVFPRSRLEPFTLADGFTVWGAAHEVPANTPNLFRGTQVDRGGFHLGLLHASRTAGLPFQEEGKQPHAPFDVGDIEAAGLHHALLGHFHQPDDGPSHTYPGNPDPLEFGESGGRGAVLVDVSDAGVVTRTHHRVAHTTFADVELDVTGCGTTDLVRDRAREVLADRAGVVRLTVRGEVAREIDLRDSLFDGVGSHLDDLVIRMGRLDTAYDIDQIAGDARSVRGRFVQDVLASDLSEEEQRRVIVTGLRALEGRHDLEVH